MWYLIYAACLVLLAKLAQFHWSRRELYKISRKLNGPFALPLVGNAYIFNCHQSKMFDKFVAFVNDFDTPSRFWLGPKLLVCFNKLEHVEKVMGSTKVTYKGEVYKFINMILGSGLISNSGEVWRYNRRLIQPMLNLKFINFEIPIMQKHIHFLIRNLQTMVNKDTFNIQPYINNCSFDIIGEILFLFNVDSQNGNNLIYVEKLEELYTNAYEQMIKPWLYPSVLHKLSRNYRERLEIKAVFKEFTDKIINASLERIKTSYDEDCAPLIDKLTKHMTEHPDKMNLFQLKGEIITLYEASQDTTTLIAAMCAVCLGMYPEYQEIAAEEIRYVFGDTPRDVEEIDIPKLHYLERCLKDVLRLVPIGPFIVRSVTEEITVGDLEIPIGCEIFIPIYSIHRDPTQYERPNEFYPDHYLEENIRKRHVYANMPFSAGPRNCIGKYLAMSMLKLIMANLLQHFRFEADGKFPDMKFKADISMRAMDGYNVRIHKRVWK